MGSDSSKSDGGGAGYGAARGQRPAVSPVANPMMPPTVPTLDDIDLQPMMPHADDLHVSIQEARLGLDSKYPVDGSPMFAAQRMGAIPNVPSPMFSPETHGMSGGQQIPEIPMPAVALSPNTLSQIPSPYLLAQKKGPARILAPRVSLKPCPMLAAQAASIMKGAETIQSGYGSRYLGQYNRSKSVSAMDYKHRKQYFVNQIRKMTADYTRPMPPDSEIIKLMHDCGNAIPLKWAVWKVAKVHGVPCDRSPPGAGWFQLEDMMKALKENGFTKILQSRKNVAQHVIRAILDYCDELVFEKYIPKKHGIKMRNNRSFYRVVADPLRRKAEKRLLREQDVMAYLLSPRAPSKHKRHWRAKKKAITAEKKVAAEKTASEAAEQAAATAAAARLAVIKELSGDKEISKFEKVSED